MNYNDFSVYKLPTSTVDYKTYKKNMDPGGGK